jgi:hypothetical protein
VLGVHQIQSDPTLQKHAKNLKNTMEVAMRKRTTSERVVKKKGGLDKVVGGVVGGVAGGVAGAGRIVGINKKVDVLSKNKRSVFTQIVERHHQEQQQRERAESTSYDAKYVPSAAPLSPVLRSLFSLAARRYVNRVSSTDAAASPRRHSAAIMRLEKEGGHMVDDDSESGDEDDDEEDSVEELSEAEEEKEGEEAEVVREWDSDAEPEVDAFQSEFGAEPGRGAEAEAAEEESAASWLPASPGINPHLWLRFDRLLAVAVVAGLCNFGLKLWQV